MTQAIGRLHNYCINERLLEGGKEQAEIHPNRTHLSCLHSASHEENGDPVNLNAAFDRNDMLRGRSELRERMAERVRDFNLVRPYDNRIVNNN